MNKNTKDEALKLALKSLEGLADYRYTERVKQALAAIREALAEPSEALTSGANEQPAPAPEVREQQEPDCSICPTCGGMASDPIVPPEYWQQSTECVEPVARETLPCPFCGNSGLDFDEGSTYRWGIASCSGCGASCGEIRREYPDKGEWHKEAIAEWNRRTSPPANANAGKPWVGLTDEQALALNSPRPGVCYVYPSEWEDVGLPFVRAIEAKLREKNEHREKNA